MLHKLSSRHAATVASNIAGYILIWAIVGNDQIRLTIHCPKCKRYFLQALVMMLSQLDPIARMVFFM